MATTRSVTVKHEREMVAEDEDILFPSSDPLAIKTDHEDEVETKVKEEPDNNDGERRLRKIFIKKERNSTKERKSGRGRPRKYATDEERRKVKVERVRQGRAKMTVEKREERLQKQREYNRRKRAAMTSEEHEEILRKQKERDSRRKGEMSKEKREEMLRKQKERDRRKKAEMTKEEHEELLRRRRERRAKIKKAAEVLENVTVTADAHSGQEDSQLTNSATPGPGTFKETQYSLEKHEEKKRKMREYNKRRKEENPEKYKELKKKYRESSKKQREMDPEKYEKYKKTLQRRREKYKANAANRKNTKETEEEREKKNMRTRLWYRKQMETEEGREMIRFRQYSRIQMQIAQMTDEELAAYKAKQREASKNWRENLSGEKLERYREKIRNYYREYYKDPELAEQRRERFNALLRKRCAQETPEQRQKRLRRYKINQTITKMRKQLEEIGLPEEEVERRVTELKSQMQAEPLPPPETLSTYKPRIKTEMVSYTPPKRRVRRSGRQPSRSLQIDSSSEATSNSQNQNGMGSTEMDNSNDFDMMTAFNVMQSATRETR